MTLRNNTGRAGHARTADRGDVQRLADDGLGRNAIARELGVSRRAVDDAATELGITWDRSATVAATRARLADTQAEMSAVLGDVASVAGRRLLQAVEARNPEPPLIRALAHAAGMASDKLIALTDRVGVEEHTPGSTAISIFTKSLDAAYASMYGAYAQDNNPPEESQ